MGFFFGHRGEKEIDLGSQGRDILKTIYSIGQGYKINGFVDENPLYGLVETVNKTNPPETVGGLLLEGISYRVCEGILWTLDEFEGYGNNLVKRTIQ